MSDYALLLLSAGLLWVGIRNRAGVRSNAASSEDAARIYTEELLAVEPNLSGKEPDIAGKQPRGIRNKNPGNIRYNGTAWVGLDNPPSDGSYCRFTDARFGIRAMARVLNSYQKRGLVSIRQIISTWAPVNENNTASYIAAVSKRMNWAADVPVGNDQWPVLIAAIIHHENGKQPYSRGFIEEGVRMAWQY